jgi:CelD/BcsL family acetyltransferase involved in cellulose biosynthesis
VRLLPLDACAPAALVSAWGGETIFRSSHWLAAMMAVVPADSSVQVLTEGARPLAYLGERIVRRHGLLRVRQWVLNETGDPAFDRITLEYNGFNKNNDDLSYAETAFGWLMQHRSHADEIVVRNATASTASALREAAAASGWHVRLTNFSPAAVVDLDTLRAAGGDLVATTGRNTRAAIRRAIRLYEESGPIRVDRAGSAQEAIAWFGRMQSLHMASWHGRAMTHAFSNPYFEPFHHALIRESFDADRVDMLRVCAGDREIGYLYNFAANGWVMAYQSGLTLASDNRWKPGLVSHCAAIAYCLERGDRRYDFLAGSARYKTSLANDAIPMESLVAFAPRWHLTLEEALRRWRARWKDRQANLSPE